MYELDFLKLQLQYKYNGAIDIDSGRNVRLNSIRINKRPSSCVVKLFDAFSDVVESPMSTFFGEEKGGVDCVNDCFYAGDIQDSIMEKIV